MSKQKVFKSEKRATSFSETVNGVVKIFTKGEKVRYVVRYKSNKSTKSHAKKKSDLDAEKYYKPSSDYFN